MDKQVFVISGEEKFRHEEHELTETTFTWP